VAIGGSWVVFLAGSGLAVNLASNAIGVAIESIAPVTRISIRQRLLGIWFSTFSLVLSHVAMPVIAIGAAYAVTSAGGGLIRLRADGWWLPCSAVIYVLAMDLLQYWRHRAEHHFPVLWAMHSFHHSDCAFNTFTTQRVYWLSLVMQAGASGSMGLLFNAPSEILLIWATAQVLTRFFNHLNLRLFLGRLSLCGKRSAGPTLR
jgi:sterol desaturase/sphingolipid hydroxylase (fatty acid hydroxylase superfamily)